jgi:SAM-dependent methyltransferase
MGEEVTNALREAQARHFDAHTPFTPVSQALRASGFEFPYILKDELIAQAILQLSPAAGHRVLDLGCGRGILLDRLATRFRTQGFGVDISRGTLKGLQSESLHPHRIACSEGENLPFRDNSFDLAVSLDVLEHAEAPEPVLAEMLRVLKPGGAVLCYAISRKNGLTFNWFLTKAFDVLGVDHWAWNGHAPDRLVDPVRTRVYLEQSGCTIHHFRPFHAFFTILFDQSVLVLYWLAMRLRPPTRQSGAGDGSPNRILRLVSALTGILFGPFDRLDRPWVSRGLSNGFLFVATKPRTLSATCQPT